MAAHVARELGLTVRVFSKKVKSQILGGQYLKMEIPGITGMADTVYHEKMGDPEDYSVKVYGRADVPCFRFEGGEQPAWSMREAYDNLWGVWSSLIRNVEVAPDDIGELCEKYDVVLSTLPRDLMCYKDLDEHPFQIQRMYAVHGASYINPAVENIIVYSGRPRDTWYRTSNLFGFRSTEWSAASLLEPEEDGPDLTASLEDGYVNGELEMLTGVKPLRHSCQCHSEYDNLHWLGRFGKWEHGVLVSDAYTEAQIILAEAKTWVS
jgi:hypothetical protein